MRAKCFPEDKLQEWQWHGKELNYQSQLWLSKIFQALGATAAGEVALDVEMFTFVFQQVCCSFIICMSAVSKQIPSSRSISSGVMQTADPCRCYWWESCRLLCKYWRQMSSVPTCFVSYSPWWDVERMVWKMKGTKGVNLPWCFLFVCLFVYPSCQGLGIAFFFFLKFGLM